MDDPGHPFAIPGRGELMGSPLLGRDPVTLLATLE